MIDKIKNLRKNALIALLGAAIALGSARTAKADSLFLLRQYKEANSGTCISYSNDKVILNGEYWQANGDNERDFGVRLPINGDLKGYVSFYGTDTKKETFTGADSSLKTGNLVFGYALERKLPIEKELMSGFIGYDNGNQAVKLQVSETNNQSRKDLMYWQDLYKTSKGAHLGGFAIRNQKNAELARFVLAHYTAKKGEGIGHRTYVQSDKKGNQCLDSIIALGSKFSRASMTSLVNNESGGVFDPSIAYNTFDSSTTYLPERGKTAFEIKAVKSKGKDTALTFGAAQNIGPLGASFHYTPENNGKKATKEITGILNLKGWKFRVTELPKTNSSRNNLEVAVSKCFEW